MLYEYKCIGCGKEGTYTRHQTKQKKFCSTQCMLSSGYLKQFHNVRMYGKDNPAWKGGGKDKTCNTCLKQFYCTHATLNRKYCSLTCYWKKLKEIYKSEIDDKKYIKNKRQYEHRIVAVEKLGLDVNKKLIVHHKNGDKTDNRPENLEVITQSEHIKEHFSKTNWGRIKDINDNL